MFSYLALGAAGAGGGLVYLAHLIRKSEQDYALRRKGFCEDIIIPRTTMDENNKDVELYHNTDSYCSQVTRACLFQAGVDWKSHHIELHPNNDEQLIDGYMNQNLSQEFRKVNPWATVPVLVHNSHPIYESKEIMLYICEKLAPESGLIPEKPEEKLLMQRWIDEAYLSGIGTKTVGACIPLLSQPLFFDHMKHVKFQTAVYTLFNHPLKMRGLFQGGLWAAVNLFGLEPPKLTKCEKVMEECLNKMERQFQEMYSHDATEFFLACGSSISLADIAWTAVWPRLESAGFGHLINSETAKTKRPRVTRYIEGIKRSKGYVLGVDGTSTMGVDAGLQSIGDPYRNAEWLQLQQQKYQSLSSKL